MLRSSVLAVLLPAVWWAVDPPVKQPDALAPSAAAPGIQVLLGTTLVPGSGRVDLGTANVAAPRPAVFTVRNAGTVPVTLAEPIRLPTGFTLVRSFTTHTLPPGQSTQFVVALNSARAGRLSGTISFGTSSPQANPFRFTVTGTVFGPPSLRIITTGDPDFRTVGPWTTATGRGYRGSAQTIAAGRGANRAVWTFTGLKPGLYQVSATWPSLAGQATDASFTVVNGTQAFPPVRVDQSRKAGAWRDAGTTWQHLGKPYRITGDRLVVRLSDQANGPVVADAVRIQRLGLPGRIVTTQDHDFQATGRWEKSDGSGWQADGDHSSATWTFTDLVPGHYRISVTWPARRRGAAAAPFTILDDGREVARLTINQHWTPDDLRDAGLTWTDLGGLGHLFPIKGKKLVVRLFNPDGHRGAGQAVLAGAVRVERIYNPGGGGTAGPLISSADSVRFLEQSTWGPNDNLLSHFQNDLGADPQTFLNEQFSVPISSYPTGPLLLDDFNGQCHGDSVCFRDSYTLYPVQNRFFTNALYGPDQLRQRVAFALHEILIVSNATDDQVQYQCRYAPYLQIFDQNAFGNYRDILYEISLNADMGHYLNIIYSSPPTPNENYGREIMQLFSIGLSMLNPDGTVQTDANGTPIPTYTQAAVTNMAKVWTGWVYAPPQVPGVTNYVDPLVQRPGFHDQGPKTLLQYPGAVNPTLPANQPAIDDLNQTIDNIFNHPNVGPFIGKQLIQKLVTSNPSPAYVARVAAAFNDDGTGVRGNLWAVVQAILLDPEARGDMPDDPNYGHLREPTLFMCNVLRAFNATSYNGTTTSDGVLNPTLQPMGMDLFRAPTVFSYYPPNFNAPGYAPLLGPEFAIFDTVTSLKRANFINQMTFGGGVRTDSNTPNGTALNLSTLQDMTPDQMADYLNNLLLHGTMSDAMRTALIQAISAVDPSNTLKRAQTAVYLVASSDQYQVQQ